MSSKPFRALIERVAVQAARGDLSVPVTSVCYDSRLAEPGALFVALRGGYTDGN
ncbi:MAG: UDP-N-acetylmuramoyl-L-alanyl-D-glutamate--2,6-diaminopimelate ligase, partial [Thermomicrobiaceae bacterium]|nr:UDP-N-acetylmuramoyl-L-alanyl-D-glutamate--2,6-diaminopimelate ligase [Thermomicrobiaceae bacterium]